MNATRPITVLYDPSGAAIGASVRGLVAALDDALAHGSTVPDYVCEQLADYAVGLATPGLFGYRVMETALDTTTEDPI